MPPERTAYLLSSTGESAVSGLVSRETRSLERAFPQQGEGGMRDWHLVTYRSYGPQFAAISSGRLFSDTPISAFLVERWIKCLHWLTTVGAQLVPREEQRSHCHAEYIAEDIAESADIDLAPPPIVVLRVEDERARVEQVDSVDGTVLPVDVGDVGSLVAVHDPDLVLGNIEQYANEAPILRFRTRDNKIRRANLDDGEDVWRTSLFAQACGCPLATAVSGSGEFALLHAMLEFGFVPVLPARQSQPEVAVSGGRNFETVAFKEYANKLIREFSAAEEKKNKKTLTKNRNPVHSLNSKYNGLPKR